MRSEGTEPDMWMVESAEKRCGGGVCGIWLCMVMPVV